MPPKVIATLAIVLLFFASYQKGYSQSRIAIIGSSTAYGKGASIPAESWVNRMKNYFLAQHMIASETDVINLAESSTNCVTGMPTGYVSPYNSTSFSTPDPSKNITAAISLNPRPTIIIVSYPTNGYDWMPFNDIINDLKVIKNTANTAGIPCYITTTQPRNTFSDSERRKLKDLKDTIVATFGFYSLDFWTPLVTTDNKINPLYNADDVHPNSAGHELLFNQVITKNIFTSLAPLPIARIDLTAKKEPDVTILKWQAAIDATGTSFEIEKSTNNIDFHTIGKIKNLNPGLTNYTFRDSLLTQGKSFYRIKAIQEQGKIVYSNIASFVRSEAEIYQAAVFPKILKEDCIIKVKAPSKENITVYLVNTQGVIIQQRSEKLLAGNNQLTYHLPSLPEGLYFLTILNQDKVKIVSEKIIKHN